MKEILLLEAEDWILSVSAPDQSRRYAMFRRTLDKRQPGKELPTSSIGFSEKLAVTLSRMQRMEDVSTHFISEEHTASRIRLPAPLMFDNTSYQFFFSFRQGSRVEEASIDHRLRRIAEAFTIPLSRQSRLPLTLVGTVKTGNNVGALVLPLSYRAQDRIKKITLSFDVFSAKLSTDDDLHQMYRSIDSVAPFLRFQVARPTEQQVSRGKSRGYFPVMWLARFETLRSGLGDALRVIINAPHNRLQSNVRYVRADRLRGRVDNKTAERVRNDLVCGMDNKRYRLTSKQLNVDTPENRFVKMVTVRSSVTLARLHGLLGEETERSGKRILSEPFLENVAAWARDLRTINSATFFADIGTYSGMKNESLVLQQRPGYSRVYAVWQELQYYLDMFDTCTSIAMCTIDKIYEIWCFLEVRRILIEDLGFAQLDTRPSKPGGSVETLEETIPAQEFSFYRGDGVTACLTHEPVFRKKSGKSASLKQIRTYRLEQKPDIFLKAQFADGRECIWLFDAKYRLEDNARHATDSDDLVPDDALNQMHRYRDALIYEQSEQEAGFTTKSRAVMAAFALYPGCFRQESGLNPYEELINEVGIGAFALLPSVSGSEGRYWLTDYLQTQLGNAPSQKQSRASSADHLYVQEPARIPFFGMQQSLYRNLVLVAGLGANRTEAYTRSFIDRSATWYHCPVDTFDRRYQEHVVRELEYLAIAVLDDEQAAMYINHVWPITSLVRLPRKDITADQAGTDEPGNDNNRSYWLFGLGSPQRLNDPVPGFPRRGFVKALRVTTLAKLSEVTHYTQLHDVYGDAISRKF